ncbi:hypothetical protein QR98_0001270 [Sarcoptes scabiei]|uniref:Uncharacterized protein n=1 Tax=Sarcoptes scabiei TaxID=52283 RepID=A0A131ZSM4_SARSC|nr:hypothetical protein QR98_0001270 [Sarcoptes scabiei]
MSVSTGIKTRRGTHHIFEEMDLIDDEDEDEVIVVVIGRAIIGDIGDDADEEDADGVDEVNGEMFDD